jgi:hypothetical protein
MLGAMRRHPSRAEVTEDLPSGGARSRISEGAVHDGERAQALNLLKNVTTVVLIAVAVLATLVLVVVLLLLSQATQFRVGP